MGDEDDRPAGLLEREDAAEALPLKRFVADREDLVEKEHVGIEKGCDGEAETHGHARGVGANRSVDRVLELGEGHDLVEPAPDVPAPQALNRPVEEHVLAAREVEVEAGSEL